MITPNDYAAAISKLFVVHGLHDNAITQIQTLKSRAIQTM